MKRLPVRQVYDVICSIIFLITIFFVNTAEAKSLKKGEVYSLLNGKETMEVISSSELEISESIFGVAVSGGPMIAEYDFKGDKLRVVATVMGMKVVKYFLLTNEGLKEEKTGDIYYSKAGLAKEKKRRAEEEKRRATYTDNGNGTVTQGTGLMWQKEDDNTKRNWESAISYCKGLSLGGHNDWRLPNIEELKSITVKGNSPTINTTYFPNTKRSYHYWSSTTYASDSSYEWDVFFSYGGASSYTKLDNYYVRCVRGGQ